MQKKTAHQLLTAILDLTLTFQKEFPTIYDNLNETPLFLDYKQKEISKKELQAYYQFLKAQLKVFES